MTTDAKELSQPWTWADKISTWRFWGLAIAYLLIVSTANVTLSMSWLFLHDHEAISAEQISNMGIARLIATANGFWLAWIAVKWRPLASLVFMAALTVIGLAFVFIDMTVPLDVRYAGYVLAGLPSGAAFLIVPAIIAGGRGGTEAFVVSFGIINSLTFAFSMIATHVVGAGVNAWGQASLIYFAMIPPVVGIILLLTLTPSLFNEQPPSRGYMLKPRIREPLTVGLLFLVPFYGLFWLYRAHGEVAALAPSRAILSPRGALLGALFVPFLTLVEMASLIDALNGRRQQNGQSRRHSPIAVFLWAAFVPPVAGAQIQSEMNEQLSTQAAP